MRAHFWNRIVSLARIWVLALGAGAMLGSAAQAAEPYLAFRVRLDGSAGAPRITVFNDSRDIQITNVSIFIGDTRYTFDAVNNLVAPPFGTITRVIPDDNNVGGTTSPFTSVNMTSFDPGEFVSMVVDLDLLTDNASFADYRTTLFNNGVTPGFVQVNGAGQSQTLHFPATTTAGQSSYLFSVPRPARTLEIESLTEGGVPVRAVVLNTNGQAYIDTAATPDTNVIGDKIFINVRDGDIVEIRAPQIVYKNIFGDDITDSVKNDPAHIDNAEERFSAIGITVNNEPQSGDPTLLRFEIVRNTSVAVKWQHDYALTVDHDFTYTVSSDQDGLHAPWAGPLTSKAVGNPAPEAKKHWIKRGETLTSQIDGQVLDFSRPGLDVRYVPKSYAAYGPPNKNSSKALDEGVRFTQRIDLRTNVASIGQESFDVGQSPPQRQQVPKSDVIGQPSSFTMYGPAGITFKWQIQFGVRVNADDPGRRALPRVLEEVAGAWQERHAGEGVFWFDPGTRLRIANAANDSSPELKALSGWFNGDGHYFPSTADLDSSDGSLIQAYTGTAAEWVEEFFDGTGKKYRGLEIPNLQRAARVLWRYGDQQLKVHAVIGQHVFQGTTNASYFSNEPELIALVLVNGLNTTVGAQDLTVWDPVASRLYPLVPGIFKATWRPVNAVAPLEVIVTVTYPEPAHYPHIANTPGVALDPDPNDDFIFKQLKYSENQAAVDGNQRFTASQPGRSVLLFSEIQRVGRGIPREFLKVRVVHTRRWDDNLPANSTAIIGQKITDPLDKAALGTGYLMFNDARFNPFIYDATRLEGLAVGDVYDLPVLRETRVKLLSQKQALPGPIIPVNVAPSAASTQRVVVVWYEDPTLHDYLLWPHQARVYDPRWPTDAGEGLGRIVIASKFGSESVGTNGLDQMVVDAATNIYFLPGGAFLTNVIPAETTYNPSRLQQVQVYNQPNPLLAGYNPNEEHALMAPSLRNVTASPRPPAVYALRHNDLNKYSRANSTFDEQLENPASFTSHPFVLVQFFDTAESEFKMRVYKVQKEDANIPNYRFANPSLLVSSTPPRTLQLEPNVLMEAGEPVIPFYPLVEVIGAAPCARTYGVNLKAQTVYWEDHKGTSWSVSGGEDAWFTGYFYYPLLPGFWWPPNQPGMITESLQNTLVVKRAVVPQVGDCVSFVPPAIDALLGFAPNAILPVTGVEPSVAPTPVLYKSDWPKVVPVLKAGETLTFSGGEYRADHPFSTLVDDDGSVQTIETPGLPGVLAFASAEVVFDSLNPLATSAGWRDNWTARVGQVLDRRSVPMTLGQFPAELQPATKRTRVKQGRYIFNELPASLQKRVRFDPLAGRLEIIGLVNDKEIGDSTLTASPPAVYILEPNILTAEEAQKLSDLAESQAWKDSVASLAKLTRNPSLLDSNNAAITTPGLADYRSKLETFWTTYYQTIGVLPPGSVVPPPVTIANADDAYLVGLDAEVLRDSTDKIVTINDPVFPGIKRVVSDVRRAAPARQFGPGLAILPNGAFLDPTPATTVPDISYVSVVENNDPSLGGSPITIHVVKVDRRERYRGSIKTSVSDNVFDENLGLRHTGDFGANADDLYFEWWYRPDDGSLNVPPPDLLPPGQANPWKVFSDPTGRRGQGRYQVTLKGNPNAPEALLADTFWFVRYRHADDVTAGTNWKLTQPDGSPQVNFVWAGAGNSQPFVDLDADGFPDYRAQLAQGWIKRVLDAVNPYEARIRDFQGDNPATASSMLQQLGARFEGPVALNPAQNVIENVGLIELYETILKRGRDLSIDLSTPVSTPAIANALQLVSTRIADFYTLLGNEAYTDAVDPTIGFGSDNVDYGSLAPSIFSFQNMVPSLIDEELGLLRGVDDFFARPVYNRLFWNFTQAEGTAAYAQNYNITDLNFDGFIDEDDAMLLFPQGHGDAWGHYLTGMRNQYELLKHENFNWVSRSEFYNIQDIVIKVDFLDERKFAQMAAAKAKVGAEIVNLTYRQKYVEDPEAQWQGYRDSLPDRGWGVEEWARRAAQGAYFDWVTANALLPSEHPNGRLEGIQKVDRTENADIAVVSANLNAIQTTFDQANKGQNPLGLSGNVVPFDISPQLVDDLLFGKTHFEQVYERAQKAMENAQAIWDNANEARNMLRQVGNSEAEFRNAVFQEDLSYKNQLIKIFGKPYVGTIGPGRVYAAGYDGPDLLLHMYVDVRKIDNTTVPGPASGFASFDSSGKLTGGDIYDAFVNGLGSGDAPRNTIADIDTIPSDMKLYLSEATRRLFNPTFVPDTSSNTPALARNGWYAINYTDLSGPKVGLENLVQFMPTTTAGYTFQAPAEWGSRASAGELQLLLNKMMQQEAQIASAIGAWDALQGQIVRELRFVNAKVDMRANIRLKNEVFSRIKVITTEVLKGIAGVLEVLEAVEDTVTKTFEAGRTMVPTGLPTAGLAFSPGDALAPIRGTFVVTEVGVTAGINASTAGFKIASLVAEGALAITENELQLFEQREENALEVKEMLKELENLLGDEPIKRIEIFKEIQALRELSDQYRQMVDEGVRLVDERAAFNKRVAAQTQRGRYQDMTFRVSRNHSLQNYRQAFDLAARYTYLAAKAYDYELNPGESDPLSPVHVFTDIVRARTIGHFDGDARFGRGGLSEALAWLKAQYDLQKSQLGINNPQYETGKMSLRTERYRILPRAEEDEDAPEQPVGFPQEGANSDDLWRQTLEGAKVPDLWQLPEFRAYCRPFNSESDAQGNHVAEPGLVLRFGTEVIAGRNFFGHPLSGGDHAYDPSVFATKIRSIGVWFSDYLSGNVLNGLPATPRVYLVPVGMDVMSVSSAITPTDVRFWKVVDQRIPVPLPALGASLERSSYIPLIDSMSERMGEPRRSSMFRAYHDGGNEVNLDELVGDGRLIGRSIWNTQWMLIIPGRMLNADPDVGLERFIEQVTDIKLVFQTYGYSGN